MSSSNLASQSSRSMRISSALCAGCRFPDASLRCKNAIGSIELSKQDSGSLQILGELEKVDSIVVEVRQAIQSLGDSGHIRQPWMVSSDHAGLVLE